jgi:hypothetical protein
MAKHNPWMDHLKKFRAAHPGMDNIFTEARKTYKKGQSGGGGALGGELSPETISGIKHTSGGAALQIEATQFSGGKKSKKRSGKSAKHGGSKKRRGSKRSGSKKRRH